MAINLHPTQLTAAESREIATIADAYGRAASSSQNLSLQIRSISSGDSYQKKLLEAEQAAQVWTQLQRSWRTCFEMTVSIIATTPLPQSIIGLFSQQLLVNRPKKNAKPTKNWVLVSSLRLKLQPK
ncbi:MAG: hypothetical protein HC778_00650 [Chamaesiphon sp. CSU_1_12]|nr:hypothetical protein [Chamaesiphon sp. CSU_1_12]